MLQIHLAAHYPPSPRGVTPARSVRRPSRAAFLTAAAAAAAGFWPRAARAQGAAPKTVAFELHGAAYSRENGITPEVDPEVFVSDPTVAVGGIGLENIVHVAGLRALRLDERDRQLFSADGVRLGFTSTKWLSAKGFAELADTASGGVRVGLHFTDLIGFGVYTIFKRIVGASGSIDVPLDGTGKNDTFHADPAGDVHLAVTSPQSLAGHSALVLIYHGDGRAHGLSEGRIGFDAHRHLIAPLQ